jgi:hypothetical protein
MVHGKTPSVAPSSQSGASEAAAVAAGPASTLPVPARLDDRDKEALRLLIRQELQGLRPEASQSAAAATAVATAKPGDTRAVEPLSNDQEVAFERARSMVDDGLARGSWSEDDRAHLRQSLRGLPSEAREQVMSSLFVAVNEGRIQPQVHGPLL